MSERSTAAAGYDRLAGVYDPLAAFAFGRAWSGLRGAWIDSLPDADRVWFLGDGTGGLTARWLRRRPTSSVVGIDFSLGMLARQRRAAAAAVVGNCANRWRGIRMDFRDIDVRQATSIGPPPGGIIAAMSVDCLTAIELVRLARNLQSVVESGGFWAVLDFVPPAEIRPRRHRIAHRIRLAACHTFFRRFTAHPTRSLVDWPSAIESVGWVPTARVDYGRIGARSILYRK